MRAAVLVVAAACAAPAAAPARPTGLLVVRCPVADATLVVDEQPIGELRLLAGGVRVHAGAHRVELRRDGFHTRYAEVTITAGGRADLELSLAEELP
jgi:hypothetical protein